MAVTLREIARRTGVSAMAVSAVLNHTTKTRVSAEKRAIIAKVAAELGYRPNIVAQTLTGSKSKVVGVIIDSCAPGPYFDILRHVEAECTRNGYRIMIAEEHDSVSALVTACGIFDQYGVDGVICLVHGYPGQDEAMREFVRNRRNIVFLERVEGSTAPYIHVDPRPAFHAALALFRECGRKPAFVVPRPSSLTIDIRIAIYREVCTELRLPGTVIEVGHTGDAPAIIDEMERCLVNQLLPEGIDAILLHGDHYGAGMLKALARRGLRAPTDLALIGWENDSYCEMHTPPLASIDTDHETQGRSLARLLLDLLARQTPEPVIVPARLILRESAGQCPPASRNSTTPIAAQ